MKITVLLSLLLASPAPAAETDATVDPETVKRAAERWGKHFVPVEIWLRRSEGEEPSRAGARLGPAAARRAVLRRLMEGDLPYDEKRPLEVAGLAVDPRTIWIPDPRVERRFVARVAAGSPAAPAALAAAHLRASIWIVRPEAELPGITPVAFAAEGGPGELLAAGSVFDSGGWMLTLAGAGGQYRRRGEALWLEVDPGLLLLDRRLEAVGYSGGGRLGLENAPEPWRGGDLAGGPVLEFAALDRNEEALRKKLDGWAPTVRGHFRREIDPEEEEAGRFHVRAFRRGEQRNEFAAAGYAVGPKLVLVNYGLEREEALRLERVVVVAGGEERPARFLGAFRRFHAFLAEIEGDPFPEVLDFAAGAPFKVSQALVALTADHTSGSRRDLVTFNRIANLERGYRGIVEPVLQHFPRPSTIVLDAEGVLGAEGRAFAGAVVEVKRESDSMDEEHGLRTFGRIDLRLMTPGEIGALLAERERAFDPRLVPRPPEREKDTVWLGVDFQPLSRELARSHGVEVPTRGGDIGVMILKVHDGSPAARAGLAAGDVLLSVQDEEAPEPWEVADREGIDREEYFDAEMLEDVPEEAREEFLASAGPPWRSPRSFLTEKLTRIGEGKKVEVTYLHEGKELRAAIPLELSPPDFDNARRFKAEDLGLTVKDLTYEVRSHYRLKPDTAGVVVAKVERGGKAAIAKVMPYEVLTSVNGKSVRDVEDFRRTLEAAKEGGGAVLELRLEKLGQSRLVRIR